MKYINLLGLFLLVGCHSKTPPPVSSCGFNQVFVGFGAGIDNPSCYEHDDTAVGTNAKIDRGVSNAVELGTGICRMNGAVCINGVIQSQQMGIYQNSVDCSRIVAIGDSASELREVCSNTKQKK